MYGEAGCGLRSDACLELSGHGGWSNNCSETDCTSICSITYILISLDRDGGPGWCEDDCNEDSYCYHGGDIYDGGGGCGEKINAGDYDSGDNIVWC